MNTTMKTALLTLCIGTLFTFGNAPEAEAALCSSKTASATSTKDGGAITNSVFPSSPQPAEEEAMKNAVEHATADAQAEALEKLPECDAGCTTKEITYSSTQTDANGNSTPPTVTGSGDDSGKANDSEFIEACLLSRGPLTAKDCEEVATDPDLEYWAKATATVTVTATRSCEKQEKKNAEETRAQSIGEFLGLQ